MHVPYPGQVAAKVREINREEWSRVVLELLNAEAGGNRTELARLIGVDYQTIRRWIAGTHRVSEENVRAVARAFLLSAVDLLVRVGYYRHEDLQPTGHTQQVRVRTDSALEHEYIEIVARVQMANVPPSVKREINQYILERRSEFHARLNADIERLLAAEERSRRSA